MIDPQASDEEVQAMLGPIFIEEHDDDESSHAHRQLIGLLGFLLPILLWLVSGWRPTTGLPTWGLLGSISAYYYTGAVAVFTGVLVALAMFLFTYKGYNNEYARRDRAAAIVAGAAAIFVAFFPTHAPSGTTAASWWQPWMAILHYGGAIVLLASFAFISLYLFPRAGGRNWRDLPADKRSRNVVFIVCGLGILAGIAWAASSLLTGAPIFWPEVVALWSFAVSWLVKGRFDATVAAVGRRTVFYGRHPTRLARGAPEAGRS